MMNTNFSQQQSIERFQDDLRDVILSNSSFHRIRFYTQQIFYLILLFLFGWSIFVSEIENSYIFDLYHPERYIATILLYMFVNIFLIIIVAFIIQNFFLYNKFKCYISQVKKNLILKSDLIKEFYRYLVNSYLFYSKQTPVLYNLIQTEDLQYFTSDLEKKAKYALIRDLFLVIGVSIFEAFFLSYYSWVGPYYLELNGLLMIIIDAMIIWLSDSLYNSTKQLINYLRSLQKWGNDLEKIAMD